MSKRLSIIKVCATCSQSFRPFRSDAVCCSRRCCGIRRQKLYPHLHAMKEANAANQSRRRAQMLKKIEGMTAEQAYLNGYRQGWGTCYQRYFRRSA